MARTYTAVPHEYLEETDSLSDVEFGRLIRALLKFSTTDEEPELKGNERFYWKRVRNQELRYRESFEEQDRARSDRARKAAEARWEKERRGEDASECSGTLCIAENAENKTKQSKTKQKQTKQKQTKQSNTKEENPVSEETGEKKSFGFSPPAQGEASPERAEKGRKGSFSPPTYEEVYDFVLERGSRVDPEVFFDYFSEGNWRDARGRPVKNWRQKVISWEQYEPGAKTETRRRSFAEIGAEIDAEAERERAYDGI